MFVSVHRDPVKIALIQLVAPGCLERGKFLLVIHAHSAQLDLRVQLAEIDLCLADIDLLVIEENIVQQFQYLAVCLKLRHLQFTHCQLVALLL